MPHHATAQVDQVIALSLEQDLCARGLGRGRPDEEVDYVLPPLVNDAGDLAMIDVVRPTALERETLPAICLYDSSSNSRRTSPDCSGALRQPNCSRARARRLGNQAGFDPW